jgi:hypothetical protein
MTGEYLRFPALLQGSREARKFASNVPRALANFGKRDTNLVHKLPVVSRVVHNSGDSGDCSKRPEARL